MMHNPLWNAYTRQVLGWRLGDAATAPPPRREDAQEARRTAERLARMHAASGRACCVLLGAGDGTLARRLDATLPPHSALLVLECDADAARAALPQLPARACLLADASPWALLLLMTGAGLTGEQCTVGWTLPAARQPCRQALETWRALFTRARRVALPALQGAAQADARADAQADARAMRLSVGCILHRDEPRLHDFFAHIPPWAHDVSVVWDGEAPAAPPPCAVPVHAQTRPLAGDFAAQRNAMLAGCAGDWCVYLDADERLEPPVWEALPPLAACAEDTGHAGGVLFPRLTFEGDAAHVRMGYGLWPDVQLRLFPLRPTPPRFTGAVHERLLGLGDNVLLAPGMPILHYSHILKDRQSLTQRLAVFNAAAGKPLHTLSAAYPSLPRELLDTAALPFARDNILLLPLQAEP